MKKTILMMALTLGLALVGCGNDDTATRATAIAALTGDATAGKALYETMAIPTCASCHKMDGTGGSPYPNLHEPARNDPSEELALAILRGGGKMPRYAEQLSDQQVADLIAHLKGTFGM